MAASDAKRRIAPVAASLDGLTDELRSLHKDFRAHRFDVKFPSDGVAARALDTLDAMLATGRGIEDRLAQSAQRPLLGIISLVGIESELAKLSASIDRCRDALREVRRDVVR